MAGTFFVCVLVLFIGSKVLDSQQRRMMVIVLITLSLGQEIIDDILRWNVGVWRIANDLPLHMCGFSLITSTYALHTRNQTAFELSYFWGFAGALQGMLTPDPARWPYGEISIFWSFMSHGIIILNVVWLIWVDGMRCRKGSLLNKFLVL